MGQYYLVVNQDRQEYICPQQLGCGAKLWELCVSDLPRILPYLLQQSNELGGGDPRNSETDHLGRWAGDRIVVVGDYDHSNLYQIAQSVYTEIGNEISPEVDKFLYSQ